jgi:hypothetical protein
MRRIGEAMRARTWIGLVSLAACNGPDETGETGEPVACAAPYAPFDPVNYENQYLRVAAYGQIVDLRKSETFSAADFATIESLYVDTAELSVKVEGREDDHAYTSDAAVGAALHADITAAIAAGKAGDDIAIQGQIVDKTLQRFFFLSVYHEMMKSQDAANAAIDVQTGWDEAFGYYGLDNDGANPQGIAGTHASRDEEFGMSVVDTVYNALVDGRCAVAEDDRAGALPSIEAADRAMLNGFGLSVVHEMDEYSEDPLEKGWEGLLYWKVVADWVLSVDPAAHAAIEAEFAKGVDALDPAVVRANTIQAFGFTL